MQLLHSSGKCQTCTEMPLIVIMRLRSLSSKDIGCGTIFDQCTNYFFLGALVSASLSFLPEVMLVAMVPDDAAQ